MLSQKRDARLIKTKADGAPLLTMRTVTRLSYALVVGLRRNGITPPAAHLHMISTSLDAFGSPADRDLINPFVRLLWERGSLFERETIGKRQIPFVH